MKRLPLLLFVLAPVALTGCQTIKAHNPFRHKEPPYKTAQQEQPLEVPPGMDQPATSEALAIPGTEGGTASGAATADRGTEAPAMTSTAPPATATTPGTAGGTTSMTLADTPDSAYHRVGLALERGGVGQVTAHDDAAHSYEVAINTTVTEKSEGGFFHRLFHHSKSETVAGNITLRVVPNGSGSLVEATGNPDAAAQVIGLLKQRLQ